MTAPDLEIHRQISYSALDRRQREIAQRIHAGGVGALLMSELKPVITLGRRAGHSELTLPLPALEKLGIEVLPTDRGGLATYHGPGQWVLFAVESLERLTGDPRGVRRAVEGLLEIALRVARHYDSSAKILSGAQTGVWTSRGKVASVGVQIEHGVLLHGLALNGYRTPTSFVGLRPCGLDAQVDFLLPNADRFEEMRLALQEEAFSLFWRNHVAYGRQASVARSIALEAELEV